MGVQIKMTDHQRTHGFSKKDYFGFGWKFKLENNFEFCICVVFLPWIQIQ